MRRKSRSSHTLGGWNLAPILTWHPLFPMKLHQHNPAALAERGVGRSRTRVGRDIICRVGDPSSVHDLVRVYVVNPARDLILTLTPNLNKPRSTPYLNKPSPSSFLTLAFTFVSGESLCALGDIYFGDADVFRQQTQREHRRRSVSGPHH